MFYFKIKIKDISTLTLIYDIAVNIKCFSIDIPKFYVVHLPLMYDY